MFRKSFQMLTGKSRLAFFLFLLCLLPFQGRAAARSGTAEIGALITNGGYMVTRSNENIAAYNPDRLFAPASVLKIATALAALDILGPAFRFETLFYLDDKSNIFIKGFGDPFLTSEEVVAIVRKLKELGCTEINDIFLDDSAFQLTAAADGAGVSDNPYDAQNSALAVNFNTINIRKEADDQVFSAEDQTPDLRLMKELAENLAPGTYRINISRDETDGREKSSRYTGELFRAFQQQENIHGNGKILPASPPENLTPFYIHRSSKTLGEIIGPLMLYSNNFIANQLFLTMGAVKYGYPATWAKSRRAMRLYLDEKHNLSENQIYMVEGSGLSRQNRVSPRTMIRLLDSFKRYYRFLPQEEGRYVKSGTLQGVYSYAGYFVENGRLDSFALLLNQEKNTRARILDGLERIYRDNDGGRVKGKSGTSAD